MVWHDKWINRAYHWGVRTFLRSSVKILNHGLQCDTVHGLSGLCL